MLERSYKPRYAPATLDIMSTTYAEEPQVPKLQGKHEQGQTPYPITPSGRSQGNHLSRVLPKDGPKWCREQGLMMSGQGENCTEEKYRRSGRPGRLDSGQRALVRGGGLGVSTACSSCSPGDAWRAVSKRRCMRHVLSALVASAIY